MGKKIEMAGKRFGRWMVLAEAKQDKRRHYMWLCRCDCGTEKVVRGSRLIHGESLSCGCGRRRLNLVGERFGRLTIIEEATRDKHGFRRYLCQCDCGNEKVIAWACLRTGDTKSCGCLQNTAHIVHGLWNTPIHMLYRGILSRCNNPKDVGYKNYGGRGIKNFFTCLEDFNHFAINNGWGPGLCIDRIENDGPYSRDNCRFVTYTENNRNRRSNVFITNTETGERLCATEWSYRINGSRHLVSHRINELGWPPQKAITTLARAKRRSAPTS